LPPTISALNTILGPPEPKNVSHDDKALEVLDRNSFYSDDRSAIKVRFDELVAAGNVRFVTFRASAMRTSLRSSARDHR
jgi:hypothetical protein